MKRSLPIILILTFLITVIHVSPVFGGDDTRSFNYKNFNAIDIGSGMHITVTQSDTYSIEASGDNDDLDDLKLEQKGNKLRINFKSSSFFGFSHHHTVKFTIKMPMLTAIALSGGAKGNIKMDASSKDFSAELNGGAYLEGNLKCGNMSFELSGGSRVNLNGSGSKLNIDGSGGSKCSLKDFAVTDANIDLSGGSHAAINMNGKLDADLSGGSHIYYTGKVELGSTDFSGGSGISKGE